MKTEYPTARQIESDGAGKRAVLFTLLLVVCVTLGLAAMTAGVEVPTAIVQANPTTRHGALRRNSDILSASRPSGESNPARNAANPDGTRFPPN